jgi:hypothetical protein
MAAEALDPTVALPALIVVEASPATLAAVARWLAAPGPAAPGPAAPPR